jgi:hypothetical protein
MSLYDDFLSSYDLGKEFTRVPCQTKSLDSCMNFYWLDPAGVLWSVGYSDTGATPLTKGRGRVSPCTYTGSVYVYHHKELCLLFFRGVLFAYVAN